TCEHDKKSKKGRVRREGGGRKGKVMGQKIRPGKAKQSSTKKKKTQKQQTKKKKKKKKKNDFIF
ncbi:hypothetical protein, partial [Vibrio parahaemolyticus]|uniref:hypothetical protein n=1 Tax=Vibrio parahaemolyticus TaxID=670 RepID=UPI000A9143E0